MVKKDASYKKKYARKQVTPKYTSPSLSHPNFCYVQFSDTKRPFFKIIEIPTIKGLWKNSMYLVIPSTNFLPYITDSLYKCQRQFWDNLGKKANLPQRSEHFTGHLVILRYSYNFFFKRFPPQAAQLLRYSIMCVIDFLAEGQNKTYF
jgi:hypothetical protein